MPLLICLTFIFISWGKTGHKIISSKSALSFNSEMDQFRVWTDYLANHASDPDNRRSTDPNESPRHYIDIDNYPEFLETGKIAFSYNEVLKTHGENFVLTQGILPWATLTSYDSLVNCFIREDWQKAEFFAADLGHYVADGHMPLHITRNYDGQFSNNNGIHSRYESTMVTKFENDISYSGYPAIFIQNPDDYIFNYLFKNYSLIDSILEADNYARNLTGSTSSNSYTNVLWEQTQNFTVQLFKNASQSFASLIYTAWVNAGSPKMETSNTETTNNNENKVLEIKYQGLLKNSVRINYLVSADSMINISVYDLSGNIVETLIDANQTPGLYSIKWKPVKSGNTVYLVVLKTKNNYQARKIIL
jgi:hypothetical protein